MNPSESDEDVRRARRPKIAAAQRARWAKQKRAQKKRTKWRFGIPIK